VAEVAVLGAVGYAGAIAAQLLHRHPFFELSHVTARAEAGQRLDDVHPRTRVPLELEVFDVARHAVDAAVVAYPHGAAAPVVEELRAAGTRVVDLSADFRLRDRAIYDDWYGEHKAPGIFGQGVYGLPELTREAVAGADLVANPGCYPTAAVLALAPLAEAGLIEDVSIDAIQGISGYGRGGGDDTHFVTLAENAYAYKADAHRHTPEIQQSLAELGYGGPVTFVPHLMPLDQGELATCFVTPTREVDPDELAQMYEQRYAEEPFVKVTEAPPGVRDVRDTNDCHIHVVRNGDRVIALAAIDNLWKGASSQAIQNLNLMLGLDETEGLL
jgi:N-acetyl-gamma-glutamyl-phosphate reductase